MSLNTCISINHTISSFVVTSMLFNVFSIVMLSFRLSSLCLLIPLDFTHDISLWYVIT